MVHALRPNPKNNIQEGWRILDFFSSHPESTNLLTYLLGDEGEPSSGCIPSSDSKSNCAADASHDRISMHLLNVAVHALRAWFCGLKLSANMLTQQTRAGIPVNWRTMDGFGVNTFILQNKEGKEVYVKFNWKTEEGAFSYTPSSKALPKH